MPEVTIEQAIDQAVRFHQAGKLAEAEIIYRQILASQPNHPDALHLLGLLAHQVGKNQVGLEMIQRAIALQPGRCDYHSNLGLVFMDMKRFDDAAAQFSRAIQLKPDMFQAHYNLGNALKEQRRFDLAIQSYQTALKLKANFAKAFNGLGSALKQQGDLVTAITHFQKAIELQPDLPDAHNNLANALLDQGHIPQAVESYRKAIHLLPNETIYHNNLAAAFVRLRDNENAAAEYLRTVQLQPAFPDAQLNLGIAQRKAGRINEAIESFRKAVQLNPENAEAHFNLAGVLTEIREFESAMASYHQVLRIKPDFAHALNNLGNMLADQGKLDEAIDYYRRSIAAAPDDPALHSNLLFTINFHPDFTAEKIAREQQLWQQSHAEPLKKSIRPHDNDRTADRRLKIGYVSPDFREHCQAFFTTPLFANHNRTQFEVFCYADLIKADSTTDRLRNYVDHWRDIAGKTDEQAAEMIREDHIDILIDLTMHMSRNRLLIFARKPAPVQAAWLAYPGSTGLDTIDYRITDPYLDPDNSPFYSEQSVRLPETFWCYDPLTDQPAVNPLPALSNNYVTFGCLNNFCKVNLGVLDLWSKVLKAIPNSRMLILCDFPAAQSKLLDHLNFAADRIEFVPRQSREKYLEVYHRIDLALDTFPYNGHTTSLDAMWMGVPTVTLVGDRVVGRAGWSQLSNVDLAQLAARSPEEYVKIATDLANDMRQLSLLRSTLRQKMQQSPLMGGPRFSRNMETIYRMMWRRWCTHA